MPWCVVQKRFGGTNGAGLLLNQLVEIPDGTRLHQLIEQRYVRLATQAEIDTAVEEEVTDVPTPPPTKATTVRRRKHGKKVRVA